MSDSYVMRKILSCRHRSFLSSAATGGEDGNGLKVEKNWANFFHVLMLCVKKSPKDCHG